MTLAKWEYQLHDLMSIKYVQNGCTREVEVSEYFPHKEEKNSIWVLNVDLTRERERDGR